MQLTRRTVLTGLALAAHAAGQDRSSGYIDAHVHVWTPDVTRFPRAMDGSAYKPLSFTPEELWAVARPCGVSRVVLVQMSFYGTDNSYMLDAIKRYPGDFAGIGIVDSEAPGVQAEMLRLLTLKVRGYRITPRSGGSGWLDTPGMQAMWRCGAQNRIAMCPLIGASAVASVDKMCEKFPDTPVVIDHMARTGVDGTLHEADIRALCALARYKNVHVKVSAFYALGKKQYPYTDLIPLIRALYDSFGPQRLMWASDSPFQVQKPHTYIGSIELVRDRLDFLSKEDREWLLRKSAEKVFFSPA
jgi:predicted TIM-barrel fold metal-dependent hydrolase